MILQQLELPLFVQSINSSTSQRLQQMRKGPRYFTTQEVVQQLRLHNARPLYVARANGNAYRQDHLIVVAVGKRDKWEVFRQCYA